MQVSDSLQEFKDVPSEPSSTSQTLTTHEANNGHETPHKLTLDMYKEHCQALEREIVRQHATAATQQAELDAMRTKLNFLVECYRSMDDDLEKRIPASAVQGFQKLGAYGAPAAALPPSYLRLAMQCAELQAELNAKRGQTNNGVKHDSDYVSAGSRPGGVRGEELVVLLRAACKQLEAARQVGGQLKEFLQYR